MLATADDVLEVTGYSADDADIKKAQAIVEVFAGRTEVMVTDITDLDWMRYAVCWQVAYMATDANSVFEQANVKRLSQNDYWVDFGGKHYSIAPLAVKALGRLTWNRTRSVSTRSPLPAVDVEPWEVS